MRDPGLQPERTQQAWSRTGWSAVAVAVYGVREAAISQQGSYTAIAVAVALMSALLAIASCMRRHQLSRYNCLAQPCLVSVVAVWQCVLVFFMMIRLATSRA